MITVLSRLFWVALLLTGVATTAYTALNSLGNDSNPLTVIIAVVGGSIGIIDLFFMVRERLLPDKSLRKQQHNNISGTKQGYLDGLLRKFSNEENLFVKLAGHTEIPSRFASEQHTLNDISAATVLHKGRFVLLGEPGAGKSTALRRLITDHIKNYQQDHLTGKRLERLPLWINLGLSGNPVDVNELLQMWWKKQHRLDSEYEVELAQNNLALYLDGLNEMPEEDTSRTERAKALRYFIEHNPDLPVIVTCRTHDYRDEPDMDLGLPKVIVQPLDNERIQEFIRSRLGEMMLWEHIRKKEALLRMAQNPYNLVMLIDVYDAGNGKLPENLHQLYDMYVETAYEHYTRKREKEDLTSLLYYKSWKPLRDKLRWLAYKMIADGKGTSASLAWAQRQIGRQALHDGINLNVLVIEGENDLYVKFYHQSLHSYFAIELLNKALRGQRGVERFRDPIRLIQQIGYLGDAGIPALKVLVDILKENKGGRTHQQLRLVTATALGELGDLEAVDPLLEIVQLDKTNTPLRVRAIEALGRLESLQARGTLLECLDDRESSIRAAAVIALANIGSYHGAHQRLVDAIARLLKDKDRDVRRAVVWALAIFRDEKSAHELVRAVIDTDSVIRAEAEDVLGEMGSLGVSALLLKIHKNSYIQAAYERLYAQLTPTEAIESLIPGLLSPENKIHELAEDRLREWGVPAVEPLIRAIQTHIANEDFRQSAGAILSAIGEPAVDTLVATLRHPHDDMRWIAARALRDIGSRRAVPMLVMALKDPYFNVKRSAAQALGYIGDRRAIRPLMEALKDTSSLVGLDTGIGGSMSSKRVCDYAAEALENFPTPEVKTALAEYRRQV